MKAAFFLIDFILWMLNTYFFYRLITNFLEAREGRFFRILVWGLGFAVVGNVIQPRDMFNITANVILFLLMLLVGFRQRVLIKVSCLLLFFPIIISLNFLTQEMTYYVCHPFLSGYAYSLELLWSIGTAEQVLFWFLFSKMSDSRFREVADILDTKSWLLLDAICLASLTAVMSWIYYTPAKSYKAWPSLLACMVTNLAAIRLVFYLAENIRGRMEQKNLKLQQDYYRELEAGQTEIRKFRHDMNNHFSVVSDLLDEGKENDARDYFQKLSGQLRAKSRIFCADSIVNAVLNSKYNLAAKQGIDCFFHIDINSLFFMDALDICTIFSNTLDNAIEACMKVEEGKRKISVKARCTENGYFSYEAENPNDQEVQLREGKFRTWKKDKKSHGIGIENVKDVVRRYKGTLDITYDDEKFCVVILIAADRELS